MDAMSQMVFAEVFGVRHTSAWWWPDYAAHVARRNSFLHRGSTVSREEAQSSVRIGGAVVAWLRHESAGITLEPF
jgi:hypothetical protein